MDDGASSGTSVSRRQVVGAGALLAIPTRVPAASMATVADDRLRAFDARYVTTDDRSIVGYFVQPRSNQRLDVVIMLPGPGGLNDAVRSAARRQALGGALVVVPDLDATLSADARTVDRAALMRDIAAHVEPLRRHPRGSGRLTIVST